MSSQTGGDANEGAVDRDNERREADNGCSADDLRGLIERIASQLTDTDQRQSAVLAHMLSRVEALGAEARSYKSKVPQEFLPAFERIEDGVTQLADRIAASHAARGSMWSEPEAEPEPQAQAEMDGNDGAPAEAPTANPTSIENEAETAADEPASAPAVATAAPAVDPVMANDETSWDQQAADALAAHYDEQFGPFDDTADDSDDVNDFITDAGEAAMAHVVVPRMVSSVPPEAPLDVRASLLDSERDWLEDRFVEIARKVEDSLSRSAHDPALANIGDRFEMLEQRFGTALQDVALRSDVEALHILEAHIAELTQQFEDTRHQLGRLDGIEHSLAAVIDRLTDPRFDSAMEHSETGEPNLEPMISAAVEQIAERIKLPKQEMPDLSRLAEGIAHATAERVASQFAGMSAGSGDGNSGDMAAVRQLLDQFINERRESEEQTAAMLDTMQRAVIRVLDRVDALEVNHLKAPAADYSRFSSDPGPRPGESAPSVMPAPAAAYDDEDAHAFDQEPAREPAKARPMGMTPRPASSPASIEQLRQDFIADARRAKEKATTGAAAMAAEAASVGSKPARVSVSEPAAAAVPLGKPRLAVEADAGAETGPSITSRLRKPSRKLLVSAIVLMIAIPGVMMLLKKKSANAPIPTSIERTQPPASGRELSPVAPTRQIQDVAPAAVMEPAQATPPEGASSKPPKLPLSERGVLETDAPKSVKPAMSAAPEPKPAAAKASANTGAGAPVENKDDLFRSNPKTRTRSISPQIEIPVDADRRSAVESPSLAAGSPPAGIAVANPKRTPSLAQIERLQERQALAQLSGQLGEAQVNAVPAALIPEFMQGESGSAAAPAAPSAQSSQIDSRRQPLDLPAAQVGPLSLRMAAAKGDPSAEFTVATRYADANGVKQDLGEAMRWYQRSASHGFAQSQYRVATFYERGLGVKQDGARAKIWYQRAAENGNVKAMHNLAVLSAGRTAKVPDYATASRWFKAAADHGLADSQFNLAVLYESGLGVSKDAKQAYMWFALAARGGDEEAKRRMTELAQAMPAGDLAEAKRLADTWRPKQADRIANDPLAASEAWKANAAEIGAI